jgi:hypothetical protein
MKKIEMWHGWKTLAIVFIILFVVETLFWIWAISIVLEGEEKETECLIDICGYSYSYQDWIGDYDGYHYDETYSACSCYNGNEIVKEVYLK